MGINKELKSLKSQLNKSFTQLANASRAEYMKHLPAGSPIPPENKIYGSEYVDSFRAEAEAIRSKVYDAINAEKAKIADAKAEAPTSEMVSAVQLLQLTRDVSADDVRNMMKKYGSNYSAYRAIRSIAVDNNLRGCCEVHPLDKQADGLSYVESKIGSAFSAVSYEKNGVNTASTSGFEVMVDAELPEE